MYNKEIRLLKIKFLFSVVEWSHKESFKSIKCKKFNNPVEIFWDFIPIVKFDLVLQILIKS